MQFDWPLPPGSELLRAEPTANVDPAVAASGGGSGGGGAAAGAETLTLHLSGTHEGVSEARRRLDVIIRMTETIIDAHPPLAAALRADQHALTRRLEQELRVKMFLTSVGTVAVPASVSAADAPGREGGGGGGEANDGDRAGGRSGSDRGGRARGGDGPGAPAAAAAATVVCVSGVPEDVEAARLYLARLDCLELVVHVERKSFPTLFGPGGMHIRQMEV